MGGALAVGGAAGGKRRSAAAPPALECALIGMPPTSEAPQRTPLSSLFDGLLLMAVPKKRVSYTKKRVRRGGQVFARGPKVQAHMSMCSVCERMRAPHRVCEREDCVTYFKHRWF